MKRTDINQDKINDILDAVERLQDTLWEDSVERNDINLLIEFTEMVIRDVL